MMKGAPSAKEMSVLFSSLVEAMSYIFHINPIAALDLLEMYLI